MSATQQDERPLQSWKEIANYLERDVRTAIRWENNNALPVRRHTTGKRSSVYAYPSELDAWRAGRLPQAAVEEAKRQVRAPIGSAVTVTVLLAAIALFILNGTILNPPDPFAKAAAEKAEARLVWSGSHQDVGGVFLSGRYLTFVDEDGNATIHDLDSGENRVLTKTTRENPAVYARPPLISPDGEQVTFAMINSHRTPRIQLRAGALRNNSEPLDFHTIYEDDDTVYVYPVQWFPGSDGVLAEVTRRDRTTRLARIHLESGAARVIASLEWGFARRFRLSPKGDYIVFDRFPREDGTTRDVFLLSVADGRVTTLIEHPADDRAVGWTPDGRVLFSSDRSGRRDLYVIAVDHEHASGKPDVVRRNLGRIDPVAAPDGSLYYQLAAGTNRLYSVSVPRDDQAIEAEPSEIHVIGEGFTTGPAWSPDGRTLLYTIQTDEGYDSSWTLVLRDSVTTGERRWPLALVRNRALQPIWSPDGQSLLAAARDLRSRDGVFRIDPATGQVEPIVLPGTQVFTTAWAPDGKSIYYVVGYSNDRRLIHHDLETGHEEELLSGTYFQGLALSPNGRYLAVALHQAIRLLSLTEQTFEEVVRLPDYSGPCCRGIGSLAWVGTTDRLLFTVVDGPERSLWSIEVNGGEKVDLGLRMNGLGQWGLNVHPDGRSVVFHANVEGGHTEVWQLENLPWQSK